MHGHLTGLAVLLYFAPVCTGTLLAIALGAYWIAIIGIMANKA